MMAIFRGGIVLGVIFGALACGDTNPSGGLVDAELDTSSD
jgi:hypothetical protein